MLAVLEKVGGLKQRLDDPTYPRAPSGRPGPFITRIKPRSTSPLPDALRALLREKPQLRVELAAHRYETEHISLAHAAHLAGVSLDRMKALLVERGAQLRLGRADEAEARQEVEDLGRVLGERRG